MASLAPKRTTLAEFLEWADGGTETHHELAAGRFVAMARPSEYHGRLGGKVRVGGHLSSPALSSAGPASRSPDRDDACYDADLAGTCAPPGPNQIHENASQQRRERSTNLGAKL